VLSHGNRTAKGIINNSRLDIRVASVVAKKKIYKGRLRNGIFKKAQSC